MEEIYIKSFFENWLTGTAQEFVKDCVVCGGQVDFAIKQPYGYEAIEVKGSKANPTHTTGQLINLMRSFSHITLLAPLVLIKKVDQIIRESKANISVGYMVLGSSGFVYIKKPNPNTYYFKQPIGLKVAKPKHKQYMRINEIDVAVMNEFKDRAFTTADISKALNTSMINAQHRITRLKKAKLIEELTDGTTYPKGFKFVKNVNKDELITLDI
ncbi:MAG: hypothetical protein V1944_01795 [Candidatus Aenigmatarchaeota archaeon]